MKKLKHYDSRINNLKNFKKIKNLNWIAINEEIENHKRRKNCKINVESEESQINEGLEKPQMNETFEKHRRKISKI